MRTTVLHDQRSHMEPTERVRVEFVEPFYQAESVELSQGPDFICLSIGEWQAIVEAWMLLRRGRGQP